MGRPILNLGNTIPWDEILYWIRRNKLNSFLFISWLQMQYNFCPRFLMSCYPWQGDCTLKLCSTRINNPFFKKWVSSCEVYYQSNKIRNATKLAVPDTWWIVVRALIGNFHEGWSPFISLLLGEPHGRLCLLALY